MSDLQVSDDEKERLLAEIGVEPSSIMIRRAPPAVPAPPPPELSSELSSELPIDAETSVLVRPALPALPPPAPSLPVPAPPPDAALLAWAAPAPAVAPEPPPRAPWRIWVHRRLLAAVVMLTAGAAWIAMWMASGRILAAALALLGIAAGSWVVLCPKKY
jgi:hypothetical protein